MPTRGKAWNSGVRAEARPVSRPCQNGEFADSASSSGRCARRRLNSAHCLIGVGHAHVDVQGEGGLAAGQLAHRAVDRLVARAARHHACPARPRTGGCRRSRRAGPAPPSSRSSAAAQRSSARPPRPPTSRVRRWCPARAPRRGSPPSTLLGTARPEARRAPASTSLRERQSRGLEQHHLLLRRRACRASDRAASQRAQSGSAAASRRLHAAGAPRRRRRWAASTQARRTARLLAVGRPSPRRATARPRTKLAVAGLDPLHHAVGRPGHHAQARAQPADRLVVEGVDLESPAPSSRASRLPRLDLDRVAWLVAGHAPGGARSCTPCCVGQVLVQRAAARHVERLRPAADGQHAAARAPSAARASVELEAVELGLGRARAAGAAAPP